MIRDCQPTGRVRVGIAGDSCLPVERKGSPRKGRWHISTRNGAEVDLVGFVLARPFLNMLCDHVVIDNGGSREATEQQVAAALAALMTRD